MTGSSDPAARLAPQPGGGSAKPACARFIPREELHSFSLWQPGAIDPSAQPSMARPDAASAEDRAAQSDAERQAGYQDGYRDGLAALESFKRSHAAEVASQVGEVVSAFQQRIDALEESLAQRLAGVALSLAHQVVRTELTLRPQLVIDVAQEALGMLLPSARRIVLRVNPEDHALVAQGVQEPLLACGGRLLADARIARGGCVVESDIGVIDAGVQARWQRAAAALGRDATGDSDDAALPPQEQP